MLYCAKWLHFSQQSSQQRIELGLAFAQQDQFLA
jgi:hypothetical protein